MTNRTQSLGLAALLLSVTLAGCKPAAPPAPPPAAQVTAERLTQAESEPSQWMTYNGSYSEQRFSRLKAINTDTIKSLGLAWFADYDTNLQQAGAPLFIDGVIYVSTAWSKVYAYDARSGKQLWQYDPKVPGEWAAKVCCGLVNRGLAAYEGKIYVGTLDGRLVALDAATGKEAWSTLTFDAAKKDHRAATILRGASVACAIERFRNAHQGQLPAALTDLIPTYLPSIPLDPANDQSLRFRPLNPGYVVYGVGPDGEDNQGNSIRKIGAGDAGTDVPFTVER
jgi:outer membrane protein assembly factor BamB